MRTPGLCQAFVMPLFLTIILFLGPIAMQICNGLIKLYTEPIFWFNNIKNLIWIRNHVVAPFSEEFTYRSCMLPLLLQCFSPFAAVVICPLFFGVGKCEILLNESIWYSATFQLIFIICKNDLNMVWTLTRLLK